MLPSTIENGGPLPVWAWLVGTLGVALIGLVASVLGFRRLGRDHDKVGTGIHTILANLLHLSEKVDSLDEKVDGLDDKVAAHLDHHRRNEAAWLGPERRSTEDRRSGGSAHYAGPERRRGTERRQADEHDV